MPESKPASEGLIYEVAVLDPQRFVRLGRPSVDAQLMQAIARAEQATSNREALLGRCVTLATAQIERGELLGRKHADIRPHLPRLRPLLTDHIGKTVIQEVERGDPSLVDLRCILNEKTGRRGLSLVDRDLLSKQGRTEIFNHSVNHALRTFAERRFGEGAVGDYVPELVETVIWSKGQTEQFGDYPMQVKRAERLLKVTTSLKGSGLPVPIVRAKRSAREIIKKYSRYAR